MLRASISSQALMLSHRMRLAEREKRLGDDHSRLDVYLGTDVWKESY